MLGYFNKKPPFIWERKRNRGREHAGERQPDRLHSHRGKSWEMESESIKQQITSCCHEIGHKIVVFFGLCTYMQLLFGICLLPFAITQCLRVYFYQNLTWWVTKPDILSLMHMKVSKDVTVEAPSTTSNDVKLF